MRLKRIDLWTVKYPEISWVTDAALLRWESERNIRTVEPAYVNV